MADKPIVTKKYNEDLDVDLMVREGGILARIYLGVQGNDLKAAKKALENVLFKKLSAEPAISLLEIKMYDILKQKNDFFSGVAEVMFVSDDFRGFLSIILRYGPSAVEIIEPSEVKLNSDQMHCISADACDVSHMYSEQIIAMFKDPERMALYQRMLKGE